jgi:hypothetical protein
MAGGRRPASPGFLVSDGEAGFLVSDAEPGFLVSDAEPGFLGPLAAGMDFLSLGRGWVPSAVGRLMAILKRDGRCLKWRLPMIAQGCAPRSIQKLAC